MTSNEKTDENKLQPHTLTIGQYFSERYLHEVDIRNEMGVGCKRENDELEKLLQTATPEQASYLNLTKDVRMLQGLRYNDRITNLLELSMVARAIDDLKSMIDTVSRSTSLNEIQSGLKDALDKFDTHVANVLGELFTDKPPKGMWG